MKFTKEDLVLTAKEARIMSDGGTDETLVREQIASIMYKVKETTRLGFYSAEFLGHFFVETQKVLTELGFNVISGLSKDQSLLETTVSW